MYSKEHFRKENIYKNPSELLKSSPNILENFQYETLKLEAQSELIMTSSPIGPNLRPNSSQLYEPVEPYAFMRNVINTQPRTGVKHFSRRYSSPTEKEATVRRSLEEISRDIKEIDDYLTATENLIKREKMSEQALKLSSNKRLHHNSLNKENKTPSPAKVSKASYKIRSFKINRRCKLSSPKYLHSRLYFKNGRIGCVEAERQANNVECTHALVKHILRFENEKPLVSPESVNRVLNRSTDVVNKKQSSNLCSVVSETLPGAVMEDHKSSQNQLDSKTTRTISKESAKSKTLMQLAENELFQNVPKFNVDEDEQDVQIFYNELSDHQPNLVESEIGSENLLNENMNRLSSVGSLDSDGQQFLRDQVRHLVRRFTARANKVKSRLEMPPTPSSASSPSPPPLDNVLESKNSVFVEKDKDKFLQSQSPKRDRLFEADTPRSNVWLCSSLCGSNNDEKTLDPQGTVYISWLCVVSLSFLYNAWVIPLRSTFPFQTKENTNIWLICDFCADIIYLLDVVFFKHRVMYLFEGFWVKNKNLTRKNYMRKLQFKLDLLALLPLELLYFKYGTGAVYLRFPRFFKIQSFWEVFRLLDRVISSPHIVRVAKTLTYMLYMIHVTATLYYAYSKYQGLGVNRWVFSGKGHPYVRSFAFATKTATSIGKNPKPEREGEFVFMTIAWLSGVFVFALLIGEIRDIISTATRNKNEYRQLEDETLEYMRRLNLPQEVQKRVKMWFKFTWDQQRTLDDSLILDSLPINLKTDIAISVHIQTLSKVQLFSDCEEALLRDLVLKLRAVTFLPGDYVCRKGEVGREMYIVKLGQVQVMGGPNSDVVLATLTEGSVFGEISLLGINGADRRTADVRSKGYANLFVLSKADLNEVIAYYPNAQAILKKRARQLMRKNAAREREEAKERARSALKADVVIGNPKTPETAPKLLQTVIQAMPYESPAVVLITKGSKRMLKKRKSMQMDKYGDKNKKKENTCNDDQIIVNHAGSSIIHEGRMSPDLLSSIQNELKSKNKFINLTDSEKALIVTTCNDVNISENEKSKNIEE